VTSPDATADAAADTTSVTDSEPLEDADAEPACQIEPTITSLEDEYFTVGCTFGPCHSVDGAKGGLVLTSGQAWDNLVNIAAIQPEAAALGLLRVIPGDPDASFLVQKVEGPAAGHGDFMPPGAEEPVDPECRIAMLRAWIAAGASP